MKKITLYTIMIIAFYSCQKKKEETNIASEEIKNINEIVEAIIIQDSLNLFSNSQDSLLFCSDLKRLKIYIPEKRNDSLTPPPPPPPPGDIYITSLLNNHIKEEAFFSSKDSLYLLKQNSNPEKLRIEKKLINQLNTTTVEKELIKRKNNQMYKFYEMTIPVFSLNRQSAYVQLDYYCGGLCGSGKAIYLKKVNGKWLIIQKWRTWIS